MSEYKNIESVVNYLTKTPLIPQNAKGAIVLDIEALPAADVVPVRRGRWIEQPLDFGLCGVAYYQCSECGKEQQTPSNYCQFCGVLMKDGDGE